MCRALNAIPQQVLRGVKITTFSRVKEHFSLSMMMATSCFLLLFAGFRLKSQLLACQNP